MASRLTIWTTGLPVAVTEMTLPDANKKASFPKLESWPTKIHSDSTHTKLSRHGVRLLGEPSSDYEHISERNNRHPDTFIRGNAWQDSPRKLGQVYHRVG